MFKQKICYKDSVLSTSDLNLLEKIIHPDCEEESSDII